jgi:hypothetical protein
MDGTGNQFFAGPGLSKYQYYGISLADRPDQLVDSPHRRAAADEFANTVFRSRFFGGSIIHMEAIG